MTTNHVDCEVLCALAVSSDLTKAEHDQLSEHMEHCHFCHDRLLEMRRLEVQLFFVQARQTSAQRLPRGMKERFSVRAISEGVPLSRPSQGIPFRSLGLVTVLLVSLLMVTATLKVGPLGKPINQTGAVDTASASRILRQEMRLPQSISDRSRTIRPRRILHHQVQSRSEKRPPLSVLLSAYPTPQEHQFVFSPEIVSSVTSSQATPKLTLDATSEVFRHNAPHLLLAEGGHRAFGLFQPPAQGFHFAMDAYLPTHLDFNPASGKPGVSPQ